MISQFADIFVQMVVLFAVGATGYAAKRLNLMDEDFDKKFSKLILNTALPALILASVLTAETLPSATKILWTAGVSCASYVVLVAIGFSITAALRAEACRWPVRLVRIGSSPACTSRLRSNSTSISVWATPLRAICPAM